MNREKRSFIHSFIHSYNLFIHTISSSSGVSGFVEDTSSAVIPMKSSLLCTGSETSLSDCPHNDDETDCLDGPVSVSCTYPQSMPGEPLELLTYY